MGQQPKLGISADPPAKQLGWALAFVLWTSVVALLANMVGPVGLRGDVSANEHAIQTQQVQQAQTQEQLRSIQRLLEVKFGEINRRLQRIEQTTGG